MFYLSGFRQSRRRNKKYDAILIDDETKKIKYVPFGDKRYEQYRDAVPLKLYSHLDHNDENRRWKYRQRHKHTYHKKFSPSWFSWYFLW